MASSTIEIGYWKIRGLAAPLRMMASYSGIPFKDTEYDYGSGPEYAGIDWFKKDKPPLLEKNALMNLPYVKDGDLVVTQSNACYLYLARKLNLHGKTVEETARTEQILFQAFELRNDLIAVAYSDGSGVNDLLTVTVPAHYNKIENWLKQHGTPFSAGNEPTVGDFHLWEMLDQIRLWADKEKKDVCHLSHFPHLKAFHERFRALPALAPYFNSPMAALQINAPMAVFV